MALRLVMLGTGVFAVPIFRGLYESAHEVVGLVTQPDRPARGRRQHRQPMKELAQQHGTPVLQPERVNSPDSLAALRELNGELFVTASYGQILSEELLSIPPRGAINVHASLLPKYRGAAPIQYALLNGETETGITIFQIEPKLDAGPVLGMVRTPIGERETYGELQDRLARLAVPLVRQVLDAIDAGTVDPQVQDPALVTKAPRLSKEDGHIRWDRPARLVCGQIRAVQPWPRPSTTLKLPDGRSQRLLILEAVPADHDIAGEPGTIVTEQRRLFVRTGAGQAVEVLTLQPEGKRRMSTREFLNGQPIAPGAVFE